MNIVNKKTKDIIPYENNPRNNQAAIAPVAKSIQEFGFKVPIIIDKNNVIVCGHTRLLAAEKIGIDEVPCILADDLSPEQIKAFRLVDNKVSEKASWDFDALAVEMEGLEASIDMSEFGFYMEPVDVSDLKESYIDQPCEEKIVTGDVYQLGSHRLMCGDSCNLKDVSNLIGDDVIDLYVTDPPYNINYESDDGKTIANDNMESEKFLNFLFDAFFLADKFMRAGAVFYIWHSEKERVNFELACNKTDWVIRQCLMWNKSHFTMGRQDYQWKHEPCLYGWKDGASHYFRPCRKNATVIDDEELKNKTKEDLINIILSYSDFETTVIDADKPLISAEHPTMKPVKLISKTIANSSKPNDIVYDSFGGSGSTLIACEQLGRCCRIMELDTHYCGVIISRWEELTKLKAVKLN